MRVETRSPRGRAASVAAAALLLAGCAAQSGEKSAVAVATESAKVEFVMKGLSSDYEFVAEIARPISKSQIVMVALMNLPVTVHRLRSVEGNIVAGADGALGPRFCDGRLIHGQRHGLRPPWKRGRPSGDDRPKESRVRPRQ